MNTVMSLDLTEAARVLLANLLEDDDVARATPVGADLYARLTGPKFTANAVAASYELYTRTLAGEIVVQSADKDFGVCQETTAALWASGKYDAIALYNPNVHGYKTVPGAGILISYGRNVDLTTGVEYD